MPEKTDWFEPESRGWQTIAERLGAFWCELMHDSAMWPIHGRYQCRACGRRYPVLWGVDEPLPAPVNRVAANRASIRPSRVPSLQSTLPPIVIILLIALASPLRAVDRSNSESALASAALAQYTAGPEQAGPWSLETVEIDASLPELAKTGRLRAIRRLLPFGAPQYQVLEIAGDRTVKQQVIVRYLSAEMKAAAIPPASTAITPANYKFRYKRVAVYGDSLAYVFQISPRSKTEGLIKGELWLDPATGAALRVSGRLVKNPSIFVKHIDVTRDTSLQNGIAEKQVTHLSVDVRFIGRAELVVQERPCAATDCGSAADSVGQ